MPLVSSGTSLSRRWCIWVAGLWGVVTFWLLVVNSEAGGILKPEVKEAKFTVEGLSPFFDWLVKASIDLIEWWGVTNEDLLCEKSYITINRLGTWAHLCLGLGCNCVSDNCCCNSSICFLSTASQVLSWAQFALSAANCYWTALFISNIQAWNIFSIIFSWFGSIGTWPGG